MKKLLVLLFFSIISNLYSQKNKLPELNRVTVEEVKMKIYDKDSTAVAVVLHESANLYLDPSNNYDTRTDYYFKIKILDKKGFDYANISIDSYDKKRIVDIKGITYNLAENGLLTRNKLDKSKIYKNDYPNKWKSTEFTMPNIKVGSVIEYTYSQISPYSKIEDWYFQSEIPKIKSEYDAAVIGNYKYNVRITGYLKLDKDKPSIDKKCVYIDGIGPGACVKYSYAMYNVPAFEEEDFMLSKKNYLSRLSFDLESFTSTRGSKTKYTTTWKEADKKLKSIFFNNQTSKDGYFKRNLPDTLFSIENKLQKSKNIYNHIKNHFTWNKRYWSSDDEKVKKAFESKSGSAGEINLSLYNSLIAADLEASLIILSTRNNGMPTTLYPIIFDFNYVIVKLIVDKKNYYLDATEKYLPFGQIPVRCLNGKAREINFNEESNWVILKPKYKSKEAKTIKYSFDDEGNLIGEIRIVKDGYYASDTRNKINTLKKEKYLEKFEDKTRDTEIENYRVENLNNLEKPLIEKFNLFIETDEILTNRIRINPFKRHGFNKNPFKLKERNYPVDFAYPRTSNYFVNIKIPKGYKVVQSPKNLAISLPQNGGRCIIKSTVNDSSISIYVRFNVNKKIFFAKEYFALKEFYNKIIQAEKSYIILEKKS